MGSGAEGVSVGVVGGEVSPPLESSAGLGEAAGAAAQHALRVSAQTWTTGNCKPRIRRITRGAQNLKHRADIANRQKTYKLVHKSKPLFWSES